MMRIHHSHAHAGQANVAWPGHREAQDADKETDMTNPHELKPTPPTPDRGMAETRSQEIRQQAAKVSHDVRELGSMARSGAESTIHSAKRAGAPGSHGLGKARSREPPVSWLRR